MYDLPIGSSCDRPWLEVQVGQVIYPLWCRSEEHNNTLWCHCCYKPDNVGYRSSKCHYFQPRRRCFSGSTVTAFYLHHYRVVYDNEHTLLHYLLRTGVDCRWGLVAGSLATRLGAGWFRLTNSRASTWWQPHLESCPDVTMNLIEAWPSPEWTPHTISMIEWRKCQGPSPFE